MVSSIKNDFNGTGEQLAPKALPTHTHNTRRSNQPFEAYQLKPGSSATIMEERLVRYSSPSPSWPFVQKRRRTIAPKTLKSVPSSMVNSKNVLEKLPHTLLRYMLTMTSFADIMSFYTTSKSPQLNIKELALVFRLNNDRNHIASLLVQELYNPNSKSYDSNSRAAKRFIKSVLKDKEFCESITELDLGRIKSHRGVLALKLFPNIRKIDSFKWSTEMVSMLFELKHLQVLPVRISHELIPKFHSSITELNENRYQMNASLIKDIVEKGWKLKNFQIFELNDEIAFHLAKMPIEKLEIDKCPRLLKAFEQLTDHKNESFNSIQNISIGVTQENTIDIPALLPLLMTLPRLRSLRLNRPYFTNDVPYIEPKTLQSLSGQAPLEELTINVSGTLTEEEGRKIGAIKSLVSLILVGKSIITPGFVEGLVTAKSRIQMIRLEPNLNERTIREDAWPTLGKLQSLQELDVPYFPIDIPAFELFVQSKPPLQVLIMRDGRDIISRKEETEKILKVVSALPHLEALSLGRQDLQSIGGCARLERHSLCIPFDLRAAVGERMVQQKHLKELHLSLSPEQFYTGGHKLHADFIEALVKVNSSIEALSLRCSKIEEDAYVMIGRLTKLKTLKIFVQTEPPLSLKAKQALASLPSLHTFTYNCGQISIKSLRMFQEKERKGS